MTRSEEDTIHRLAVVACPHLTPEELEEVRGLGENVPAMLRRMAAMLRRMAAMLEGIGCMAASDDGRRDGGGRGAGSFQDGDTLGDLLFTTASFARMATGMLYAAGHADSFVRYPELHGGQRVKPWAMAGTPG